MSSNSSHDENEVSTVASYLQRRERLQQLNDSDPPNDPSTWPSACLSILSTAFSSYSRGRSSWFVLNKILDRVLDLCECEYGFIGVYTKRDDIPEERRLTHEQNGRQIVGELQMEAITNIAWTAVLERLVVPSQLRFPCRVGSLLADAVDHAFVTNTPWWHERAGTMRLPEGHPSLNNFLAIPFFEGTTCVAVLAMANRSNGNMSEDMIQPLTTGLQGILFLLSLYKYNPIIKSLTEEHDDDDNDIHPHPLARTVSDPSYDHFVSFEDHHSNSTLITSISAPALPTTITTSITSPSDDVIPSSTSTPANVIIEPITTNISQQVNSSSCASSPSTSISVTSIASDDTPEMRYGTLPISRSGETSPSPMSSRDSSPRTLRRNIDRVSHLRYRADSNQHSDTDINHWSPDMIRSTLRHDTEPALIADEVNHAVMESIDQAVIVADSSMCIRMMNRGALRMLKLKHTKQLIGLPISTLFKDITHNDLLKATTSTSTSTSTSTTTRSPTTTSRSNHQSSKSTPFFLASFTEPVNTSTSATSTSTTTGCPYSTSQTTSSAHMTSSRASHIISSTTATPSSRTRTLPPIHDTSNTSSPTMGRQTNPASHARVRTVPTIALCGDGTSLPVELVINSFLYLKRKFVAIIVHDTTLRHQQAADKDAFIAFLSHELRNPLHAIASTADMLSSETVGTPWTEQHMEHVRTLVACSTLMISIVSDVLDMSKVTAGKMVLECIPLSLHTLMDTIMRTHRAACINKHIILESHVSDDIPRYVCGDPTRVTQVITNLLSNSVKFTPDGGTVTLNVGIFTSVASSTSTSSSLTCEETSESSTSTCSSPNETTSYPSTTSTSLPPSSVAAPATTSSTSTSTSSSHTPIWIQFEVHDTGIGIPADAISHLFEAYTQAKASIVRQHGGTGLGLAIVYKMVTAMGGHISVTSQVQVGTTVTVRIPFQPEQICSECGSSYAPTQIHTCTDIHIPSHTGECQVDPTMQTCVLSPPAVGTRALSRKSTSHPSSTPCLSDPPTSMSCPFRSGTYATTSAGLPWDESQPAPISATTSRTATPDLNGSTTTSPTPTSTTTSPTSTSTESMSPTSKNTSTSALASTSLPSTSTSTSTSSPSTSTSASSPITTSTSISASTSTPSPSPSPSAPTLLIVDDEEINRKICARMLQMSGITCTIETANNGAGAWDAVKTHHYAVVLMDISMPVMDGLQACQLMRAAGYTCPIIGMSGNAQAADREAAMTAGFTAYLIKPFNKLELTAMIRKYLPTTTATSPAPASASAPPSATQSLPKSPSPPATATSTSTATVTTNANTTTDSHGNGQLTHIKHASRHKTKRTSRSRARAATIPLTTTSISS